MSDSVTPESCGPVEMHSPHHTRAVSGRMRRRLVVGSLVVLGVDGAAVGAGMLTGFLPHSVVAGDPNASGLVESREHGVLSVKVVRPRRDANFRITTQQFATVEP